MTETVAQRHHLEHIPLAPPGTTSGLLEVFRRRYLLRLMVRREIQARYARSFFGLAWSYINPAVRFLTFYFVFGLVLGRGMGVENFAIHLFAGMVLVHYFTESITSGTSSLLKNKGVVQKMAMPRELFPFASMLVSLYHTLPQLVILSGACVIAGWDPDLVGFAAALLGFAIVMLFGTAMGLMFSVFNVLLRDFGRIVQTFINMLPFTVPMMYPYSMIEAKFGGGIGHTIYMMNPATEAVLLMQRGFWYTTTDQTTYAESFPDDLWSRGLIMLAIGLVLLVVAQWVFTRYESKVPEMMT
ncbi:ABC transporter permease [Nocardioides sp. W7]|uniref:ABC transporter permease n=1 Tax=Nocardioides sp. W7 TaxID=2931390 RepID=UPI001FD40CDB|nr:ABC transporter permease [Nocardioides sp. W7]